MYKTASEIRILNEKYEHIVPENLMSQRRLKSTLLKKFAKSLSAEGGICGCCKNTFVFATNLF